MLADRALGVPTMRTLFRTVLPNALTPLIVQATLGIASGILDAAALGFLGLGQKPPDPEWGTMLGSERSSVFNAPHLARFPRPGDRADGAGLQSAWRWPARRARPAPEPLIC